MIALCRTMEQIASVGETDVDMIYADFEFTTDYPKAVQAVREFGKPIVLATPRIHMPNENGVLKGIQKTKRGQCMEKSERCQSAWGHQGPVGKIVTRS